VRPWGLGVERSSGARERPIPTSMATIERTDEIRVFLADDHPLILEGIRALIENAPGMEVVGEATNGDDAVVAVLAARPDVAVIDVRMPGIDGVEATRRIVRDHPETRVIVLSAQADADIAVQALRAGAIGFLPKAAFGTTLLDGIRSAASGEVALTPDMMSSVVRELHAPAAPNGLTEADRRLLELVAEGCTNTQIARTMSVSVSTVKAHLSALFKRLGARDRASAIAICFRKGWLS
jgi:DNA-binding NarL/FixJ family response regulator